MITTLTRALCTTALALAALASTAAAQDLDGRWLQVTLRARVATFVEMGEFDGGFELAQVAKTKSVKAGLLVKLHFDEIDELGGELYRTESYIATPEGLLSMGDSTVRILGGAFSEFELFVYDGQLVQGEWVPKAIVAATFAGKISKKTDGQGDVTKVSMVSLGGLVEEAVVVAKGGESACYGVGGARLKARLMPDKKVAQLPPVID